LKKKKKERGEAKVRAKTRVFFWKKRKRLREESSFQRLVFSEATQARPLFFCPSQGSAIESRIDRASQRKQNEGP